MFYLTKATVLIEKSGASWDEKAVWCEHSVNISIPQFCLLGKQEHLLYTCFHPFQANWVNGTTSLHHLQHPSTQTHCSVDTKSLSTVFSWREPTTKLGAWSLLTLAYILNRTLRTSFCISRKVSESLGKGSQRQEDVVPRMVQKYEVRLSTRLLHGHHSYRQDKWTEMGEKWNEKEWSHPSASCLAYLIKD